MTHIEQRISYSPTGNNDSGDRAKEVDGWNIEHARYQASENGIEISDEHLDVIRFLRDYYVEHGWPKRTHALSRILARQHWFTGVVQLRPDDPRCADHCRKSAMALQADISTFLNSEFKGTPAH